MITLFIYCFYVTTKVEIVVASKLSEISEAINQVSLEAILTITLRALQQQPPISLSSSVVGQPA